MKTYKTGTEMKDIEFATWQDFQHALSSKLWNHLNLSNNPGMEVNGDLDTWKKISEPKTQKEFLNNLSHEMYWMVTEGLISWPQVFSAGINEADLLVQ